MLPPPPPTILLIPGSFASSAIYQPIIDRLRAQGYPALAVTLPSTQKRYPLPGAGLADDAALVRGVVGALVEMGREVVVLCHSYGGVVGSEAVGCNVQGGKGRGGVKKIIYLAAVVPRVGQSQVVALDVPAGLVESAVDGYMHTTATHLAPLIGNDLPSWEEAYEHALLLPHHSAASFTDDVTQVAYAHIPASYILCERDLVIPPEVQQRFIAVLREEGRQVGVVRLDAGHCPHWSRPGELVRAVLEAVGGGEQ